MKGDSRQRKSDREEYVGDEMHFVSSFGQREPQLGRDDAAPRRSGNT
jgi:hypothetical protein